MNLNEMVLIYSRKEKHYEISDAFVKEGWGQAETSGNTGYIAEVRSNPDIEILPQLAEPNQKWHFLELYVKEKSPELPAKAAYSRIKCPELLLWMAEAAGVDKERVMEAKNAAINVMKEKRKAGSTWRCRTTAGSKIREIIPWEMIENNLK